MELNVLGFAGLWWNDAPQSFNQAERDLKDIAF